MHHKQIKISNFNIYYSPVVDPRCVADKGAQITIGDMHANSMKFIKFLVKHDILRIDREDYRFLSCVYNIPLDELTPENYATFWKIIEDAEVNPEAKLATARLIGDEFGDRGEGDHFTFPIAYKLGISEIPWVSCLSNHVISLIRCYEKNWEFTAVDVTEDSCRSILVLQQCIERDIISREKVDHIIRKYYLPNLRISDYAIHDRGKLTHFMHASFDDGMVINIARQLGVNYDETSTESEKNSLDKIQEVFKNEYVMKGKISTLLDVIEDEYTLQDAVRKKVNNKEKTTAVFDSVWNREKDNLKRKSNKIYVNGHSLVEKSEVVPDNVVELDNLLGKRSFYPDSYQRQDLYEVFYTHDTQEMSNAFALEVSAITIYPEIEKIFGQQSLEILLRHKEIYSRVQIQCLNDFLGSADSVEIWNRLFKDDNKLCTQFVNKLKGTYELWDVMFLLKKHNILNADNFKTLLGNSRNSETLYQILLLLQHCNLLNTENNIQPILKLKNDLKCVHDYLIELIQYNGPDNIDLGKNFNKITNDFNELSLHVDKLKAMNTICIVYQAFKSELTDDYFEKYMLTTGEQKLRLITKDVETGRLAELFAELETDYFSDVNEVDENSSSHSDSDTDEEDDDVKDEHLNDYDYDDVDIDVNVNLSPTNYGDDVDSQTLAFMLGIYGFDQIFISVLFKEMNFSGKRDEIQKCLLELLTYEEDIQNIINIKSLKELLMSSDAMIALEAIWPVIKSGKLACLSKVLGSNVAAEIIEFSKITVDLLGSITLDQLLYIASIDDHRFQFICGLSEELQAKNIWDVKKYDFIFKNTGLAQVLYTVALLLKNNLTDNLWDVLVKFSDRINSGFYYHMEGVLNNSGLHAGEDELIAEITAYFGVLSQMQNTSIEAIHISTSAVVSDADSVSTLIPISATASLTPLSLFRPVSNLPLYLHDNEVENNREIYVGNLKS